MQYILSEEEYKKLIHKDRIRKPIEEFLATIHESGTMSAYGGRLELSAERFRDAYQTLQIKLDL